MLFYAPLTSPGVLMTSIETDEAANKHERATSCKQVKETYVNCKSCISVLKIVVATTELRVLGGFFGTFSFHLNFQIIS